MDNLTNTIYEDITERFGYAKLGEFNLIIDRTNNYANATKLCKDGGKRYRNWVRLDSTVSLFKYYEESNPLRPERVITIEIGREDAPGLERSKQNAIMGTYIDINLIIQLAQWISNEFAIKVSYLVIDYYNKEYIDEINAKERANKELRGENLSLLEKMDKLLAEGKKRDIQYETLNSKLDKMSRLLEGAVSLLEKEPDSRNQEMLVLYRKKGEPHETIHIHACKRSSVKIPKESECTYLYKLSNITNAKRILRYLGEADAIGILARRRGCFAPIA